jgi:hypothetical protein
VHHQDHWHSTALQRKKLSHYQAPCLKEQVEGIERIGGAGACTGRGGCWGLGGARRARRTRRSGRADRGIPHSRAVSVRTEQRRAGVCVSSSARHARKATNPPVLRAPVRKAGTDMIVFPPSTHKCVALLSTTQDLVACIGRHLASHSRAEANLRRCRTAVGSGHHYAGRFDCSPEVNQVLRALAVRGVHDPVREAEQKAGVSSDGTVSRRGRRQ